MPFASDPDAPHRGSILHRVRQPPSQKNVTTAERQHEDDTMRQNRAAGLARARHDARQLVLDAGRGSPADKATLRATLLTEEREHLERAAQDAAAARGENRAADAADAAHAVASLSRDEQLASERRQRQRQCMQENERMMCEQRQQRRLEKAKEIQADIEAFDSPSSILSRLGLSPR